MSTAYRLGELARRVRGAVQGDADLEIRGIATLEDAGPHELSFLTNPRYREMACSSRAAALLVGSAAGLAERTLLVAPDPYLALAELLELFHPGEPIRYEISADARVGQDVELRGRVAIGPFAVVGQRSVLGDGTVIGAGCVLGDGCHVGEQTVLRPRVVLYAGTHVGSRCLIHSGAVLGADGYGFATIDGKHRKVPQVGMVIIEDDVEIGANSTIDRAMLGQTRIGQGSKIDNLVMVAHGVHLGSGALLAGQAGIAGSARLGRRATLAGQSGVAGHLKIGDSVTVGAKSAVFEDLDDGAFVAGIPAVDHRRWKRSQVFVSRLPKLRAEIRQLQARVGALEDRLRKREP